MLTAACSNRVVTRQASSPNWMKRASRKRVRLTEIQPYVFCQNYKHKNQRRGQSGAFEIAFLNEGGKSCTSCLLYGHGH